MTIVLDLNKNTGNILDLTKEAPSLTSLIVKLDWDPHPVHGTSMTEGFDLDIFAFVLNAAGKISGGQDVVFFNNKDYAGGAIVLPRDNTNGAGDDDEEMIFTINKIPADKEKVAIFVTIHEAAKRSHHFGMIGNARLLFIDADKPNDPIAQYNLTSNYSGHTAFYAGDLVRGWKFEPVGDAASADPNQIAQSYV